LFDLNTQTFLSPFALSTCVSEKTINMIQHVTLKHAPAVQIQYTENHEFMEDLLVVYSELQENISTFSLLEDQSSVRKFHLLLQELQSLNVDDTLRYRHQDFMLIHEAFSMLRCKAQDLNENNYPRTLFFIHYTPSEIK
jgi:hypothetical protein